MRADETLMPDDDRLSAVVDGEADAAVLAAMSAAWKDDGALRARWHAYHLIGDVLRSDELAGAGRDALFVQRVRERLQQEPVVLAPAATAPAARSLRRWRAPAAVAAGFIVVAGALTVTRAPSPRAPAPELAQAAAPAVVAKAEPAPERAEAASMVLIRDAGLDQYLAAHKQFGGSSALGVPSGFLRSATYEGAGAAAGAR